MIPRRLLVVNGISLAAYGFVLAPGALGVFDVPQRAIARQPIRGRAGGLVTDETIGSRPLTLKGTIKQDTHAALIAAIDQIQSVLAGNGIKGFRLIDREERALYGHVLTSSVAPVGPDQITRSATIEITIEADSYAVESPARIVSFGATPVPIELGTAPSAYEIRVAGPTADGEVTIVVRDHRQTEIFRIPFTLAAALGSDDYLHIFSDGRDPIRYDNGTPTSALQWLTPGYGPLGIEPGDGSYLDGTFPTAEVHAGPEEDWDTETDNGTGTILYARQFA